MRSEKRSFIEEARRAQIIEHGIDVIAELGYTGAALSKIAERAGISKGVISYHFDGKAELLSEIVRHIFAKGAEYAVEHWFADLGEEPSARELLQRYLRGNFDYIARHRKEVGVLHEIIVNFRGDDGQQVFGARTEEPVLEPLIDIFTAGQAAGEFADFEPRVMAIAVRRVIDGYVEQLRAYPDFDVDEFTEEVVAMFDRATRA